MSPIELRPYEERDLEAVLGAWELASLLAHSFLDPDFFPKERQLLAKQWIPLAETTVAVVGGQVVGFLSLVDSEVGGIFVDPDHHGTGVGRALMDHALAVRPFVELGVFESNVIGRRFYDGYGFQQTSRQINEETGQVELRLRIDKS